MTWAADNEKPILFKRGDLSHQIPLYPGDVIVAHSAHFEYLIYNFILHKRLGWPPLWDPAYFRCTMVRAMMCGFPADLDGMSRALNLRFKKDLKGRGAMLKLCSPIGFSENGTPIYNEDPGLYEEMYAYNILDVETERDADKILPELVPQEQKRWELDLKINLRGIAVDVDTAAKAAQLAEGLKEGLNSRLFVLTNGWVDKATRRNSFFKYVEACGVSGVTSLAKDPMADLMLREDVPDKVKQALRIKGQVTKSSTAKYTAMVNATGTDGRARGTLQFNGAWTGRWAGRLIQLHNVPKGFKAAAQAEAIENIRSMYQRPESFALHYGADGMDVLSGTLRGMLMAGPGKKLLVADYNAIEARIIFWLAGEKEALAGYGRGESPYIAMANELYNRKDIRKPSEHDQRDKEEYDIGKRSVLGFGYGMGEVKFQDTVKSQAQKIITIELAKQAKVTYRKKYTGVVALWKETEKAVANAIRFPGKTFTCAEGRITYGMTPDRQFLVCKLPSGRYLWYYKPELKGGITPWGAPNEEIRYWSFDSETNQFIKQYTYGGKLVENYTQAIARDILVNGIENAEAADFPTVLTVHDEDIAEVPEARGVPEELDRFIKELCTLPAWADGCPIAAEGFITVRYHK